MKKLVSLLLTLAMLFALAVPAMAAEEEDTLSDAEIEAALQEVKNEEIKDKGGVPGQVNVMVDGKCIQFPDTAPKIVDSRTMLPVRAVTEGLGMIVDWNAKDKTITISRPDIEFSVVFTIGSRECTVYHGEEKSTVTMDCAAYIDGGRTMVPVRFMSEALGYTVLWDNYYRTVVIVDQDAVIADIDKGFSKINEAIVREAAMMAKQDAANYATASFNGTATIARVLTDGDSDDVYSLSGSITAYQDDNGNVRGELKLDASALIKAIVDDPEILGDSQDKLNLEAAMELIKNGLSMNVLVMNDGTAYFNVPMLSYILEDFPENTWFKVADLVNEDVLNATAATEASNTVGTIVMAVLAKDEGAFHFFDSLDMVRTYMPLLFGDALAKEDGGTTTWTANEKDLRDLLEMCNNDRAECVLSVNEKGESEFAFNTSTDFFDDASLILLLGITGNNTEKGGSATLKASLTNVGSLSLEFKTTYENKTVKPVALPAGAQEVDLSSLALEDLAA